MEEETRCVLTLPLLTEPWQEHIIEKRFAIIEHLKNQLIGIELRKLKNLQRTKAYHALNEAIIAAPEDKRKPLYRERNTMLRKAGFSEFAFKDDMAGKKSEMQKHFSEHIATQIAHKAASDVWRAFEKYLFSNGREVHFHKRGTLESVACQTAGNGMSYANGLFIWAGGKSAGHPNQIKLTLRVTPPRNEYERRMLEKPVKNMRIVRRWMKTRYKYYLQLTLVGAPVPKERKLALGRVGIDIGPRTVAIASNEKVLLLELADGVNNNHRKKLLCQQKMDLSKRSTNPQYYNEDGTVKRLPRGEHYHWVYSAHYRKLAGKVRELERKNAAIRKYQHTCLANDILALGDEIYVEKMSFSGLQHRAKETKVNEKGRYQKKKRFGKSIANKAPAMLLLLLKTKASAVGATLHEVDTRSFRASQLDHTSGVYTPALLSARWKTLSDGNRVQRDLYSAFLLMNSKKDLTQSDLTLCNTNFEDFRFLHDREVERILSENKPHPASFGF